MTTGDTFNVRYQIEEYHGIYVDRVQALTPKAAIDRLQAQLVRFGYTPRKVGPATITWS